MAEPRVTVTVQQGLKPREIARDGRMTSVDDKTPTLIQNDTNQYVIVPRYLAEERVKLNKAVILTPAHGKEYLDGMKLALGIHDGANVGDFVQKNGKFVHAADLGKIDVAGILKGAEEAVKKYEADKKTGLVHATEMPPELDTFQGKKNQPGHRFTSGL